LLIGFQAHGRDDVSASPKKVLEFREATPTRGPAAASTASVPEPEPLEPDPSTEAALCGLGLECPIVSQQRSPSLNKQGKKTQQMAEAALRKK